MVKRCCANCMYAKPLTSHWLRILVGRFFPGLLICFNCAQCPGEMTEVFAHFEACRNFRLGRCLWGKRGAPPKAKNGVCLIPLTQGQVAMVDPEDYDELMKHRWTLNRNRGNMYACRRVKRKQILMHRVIMKAPEGLVVDHIDGNGLNNCKSNLRVCTREQNSFNIRPRGGSSRFKGVSYVKRTGKYRAVIGYKRGKIDIGEFDDPVDAARARDMVARELQGEHAWLNLPGQDGARQQRGQGVGPVPDGQGKEASVSAEVLRAVQGAVARARRKHPRYIDLSGSAVAHSHAVANLTVIHGLPAPSSAPSTGSQVHCA
jgi:hypothetical protein